MIFDSKRKPVAELEPQPAALAEGARAEQSIQLDDDRAVPIQASRRIDEETQRSEDRTVVRTNVGVEGRPGAPRNDPDDLEPLFSTDVAADFRQGWDAVQIGFVDDPRKAVQDADALVNRVLQSLSESFRGERGRVEAQVAQASSISTEDLRVALRRYRSFLHRLLSL